MSDGSVAGGDLLDARRRFLEATGFFDADWYARRSASLSGLSPAALLDHYLEHGAPEGLPPSPNLILAAESARDESPPIAGGAAPGPDESSVEQEMKLIDSAGLFDAEFYLACNPGLLDEQVDPLEHFCTVGWRELRQPRADFDTWWYWSTHLDPARAAINPLVHYALAGLSAGLPTGPSSSGVGGGDGSNQPTSSTPRRVCLFAARDGDARIDEAVVAYVEALSEHADVYFLSAAPVQSVELTKVAHATKGAWGIAHGGTDFGSFSLLAQGLVGWKRLERYDELVLANDALMLETLAPVFSSTASVMCDWWTIQPARSNVGDVLSRPVGSPDERPDALEAYLWAFRRSTFDRRGFRRVFTWRGHRSPQGLAARDQARSLAEFLTKGSLVRGSTARAPRPPSSNVGSPTPRSSRLVVAEDRWTPTFGHWWAFPVCARTHRFAGSERAVFEEVKDDPSIRKIVLTRSRDVEVFGDNVVVVPLASEEGQHLLLRSGQVFVRQQPRVSTDLPLSVDHHNFIQMWPRSAVERFGAAVSESHSRRSRPAGGRRQLRAAVSGSLLESMALIAALAPLDHDDVWRTGHPRLDFLSCALDSLTPDLGYQWRRLEALVGQRRLVLLTPGNTFFSSGPLSVLQSAELSWLRSWLSRHDAVLGIRTRGLGCAAERRLAGELGALELSCLAFPDIEVLMRKAWALWTGSGSTAADFLLTGRPIVGLSGQGGDDAFFDLDTVLPRSACRDFGALRESLEALDGPDLAADELYTHRRRLIHDHLDGRSARRVVERVRSLHVSGGGE